MLRLLKYFLSERAASALECLTDNSGDANRRIYSNLCLDRKSGYQHARPHLHADSAGRPAVHLHLRVPRAPRRTLLCAPAAFLVCPRGSLAR